MWEIVIIGGKLFIFSHKIPSEKDTYASYDVHRLWIFH